MMKPVALLFCICLASTAGATCPDVPPDVSTFRMIEGDDPVPPGWLMDTLTGKTLTFAGDGTEHYREDGSYRYSGGGVVHDALSYRFYANGVRCIGYADAPRMDLYVINDGTLLLINFAGRRFVGRVSE